MPRIRTGVVDQDDSWTIREKFDWDSSSPLAPQDDYFIVDTFDFPIYSSGGLSYDQFVIWGVGLISFGPVTPEQTQFMANIASNSQLMDFPGEYAAFSYSDTHLETFEYGVKDGYVYVTAGDNPMISITPDGLTVVPGASDPGYFGFSYGGYLETTNTGSASSLYFSDLNWITGSSGTDHLTGTIVPETLLGYEGDDHLDGGAGGDRLVGDVGNDELDGGSGNDRISGGDDDDSLIGGDGNDSLFGDAGNDVLAPGAGMDEVDGGDGVDRLILDFSTSASSMNFHYHSGYLPTATGAITVSHIESVGVTGSQYVDVMQGTDYNDRLLGGDGYDLLQGGDGNDLLDAGPATSTSRAILPGTGISFADAVPMDRYFDLSNDDNTANSTTIPHATLNVDVHTDQFEFGQEIHRYLAVTVDQAGAVLTIDVDGAPFGVDTQVAVFDSGSTQIAFNNDGDYPDGFDPGTFNGLDSLLTFTFDAAGTYYIDIASIISDPNIDGSFSVHFSLTSADVATADVLKGGAGNDTYVISSTDQQVFEGTNAGTDTVRSTIDYVLGGNVENLELKGSASIDGTGNSLDNLLLGNPASNELWGQAGADTLDGQRGADIMHGGQGDDRYFVDNIGDVVKESAGQGVDTVNASVSYGLSGQVEKLVLLGSLNINGTGNSADNTIIGNDGINSLNGGAGADTMKGGNGSDTYIVDNGGDRVIETNADGTDKVNASVSFILRENVENLSLTGNANINGRGNELANQITGNGANNSLFGFDGADTLSGGSGNDRLYGGLGIDKLTGGAGADQFAFDTELGSANRDNITDFNVAADTMVLDQTVFAALTTGNLAAGAFFTGTAAHDASDRIVYNSATGNIYYDADGNGAGAQLLFAHVTAGLALTNADFLIVT